MHLIKKCFLKNNHKIEVKLVYYTVTISNKEWQSYCIKIKSIL